MDARVNRPAARLRMAREAMALAAVVLVAVCAFAWQSQQPQTRTGTGDSYWYLLDADRYAGADPAQAAADAGRVYCAEVERAHRLDPRQPACVRYDPVDVPARYTAIFSSRPGYPLALAPLVAILGLARGAWIGTGALFVLLALTAFEALRASAVGRVGAVLGAGSLCLLPLAFWDSRMLAEGAAQLGVLLAVLAAVLLRRRSGRPAMLLLAGAIGWTFVAKPAQAAALCLALLAAAGVGLAVARRRATPTRRWIRSAGVAAALGGMYLALGAALRLPTLTDTVQDMATRHFRSSDIADPMPYLLRRAAALWWHLPRWLALPWPLVLVLAGCAVVLWRARGSGLVWSAAGLSGVLVVSAHPLASEYPRLIANCWIVVAAAVAMLYDAAAGLVLQRRSGPWPRRVLAASGYRTPLAVPDHDHTPTG
jgi:hypothetical protein